MHLLCDGLLCVLRVLRIELKFFTVEDKELTCSSRPGSCWIASSDSCTVAPGMPEFSVAQLVDCSDLSGNS